MGVSAPVVAKANGLSTVVNTIAAPGEAFETLRAAPTWGWAFILALVLLLAGTYLQGPASRHASVAMIQQSVASSSLFANMTAAQKQQMVENAGKPSPWPYLMAVVTIFAAAFFNALIMLAGNAAGRGQADFKRLWCGSMNIAVPTLGLGALAIGFILTMRGADSFNSPGDIAHAMPSLAMLAGHSPAVTVAFLSGISIFTLWGFYLNALMLRTMGRTGAAISYTFAAVVLLLGAAIAAGGVAVAHSFGMV